MKTIGIIGGLGTETTADFYTKVAFACAKAHEVHRPPMIICNVPSPFALEEDVVQDGKRVKDYQPLLIEAAQTLEKAGADFVVLPCNTLHLFIDDIAASINIPTLSIIEAAVTFIKTQNIQQIGLISTGLTRSAGFYQKAFIEQGIKLICPDQIQQDCLGRMIVDLLHGQHRQHKAQLEDIVSRLAERGASHILLACTDLQVLKPRHTSKPVYDTMDILAQASVAKILADTF